MSRLTVYGGGGGTSPLTTKGDLYGYSTAGARVPVGTDGQALVADSTQAAGVTYGYFVPYLPLAADERVSNVGSLGEVVANGNTWSLVANTLWLTPLLIRAPKTFTKANIGVATASASGNVRIGLYTMNTSTPVLILDIGAVSTATAGFKTISPISLTLAPGWYLAAFLADTTYTAYSYQPAFGFSRAGSDGSVFALLSATQTYGALPASPTVARSGVAVNAPQFSLE